jgi:hypothetical protein
MQQWIVVLVTQLGFVRISERRHDCFDAAMRERREYADTGEIIVRKFTYNEINALQPRHYS